MSEDMGPEQLVDACRRLAECGLATSTSGNLSCRKGQAIFATPTGVPLGEVSAEALSRTDLGGQQIAGPKPTKELGLHLAIYQAYSDVRAVVHVHPTHAVAVSTLLEAGAVLPSVTPQFVMRAGRVPVLPYVPPGSDRLGPWLAESKAQKAAWLAEPRRCHVRCRFPPGPGHFGGTGRELPAVAIDGRPRATS
jgi:L-fuculose-phosphate aldolase